MPKHIKNTTTGQEMEVFYAFDGEKVRTIAPQGERIYLGGMEYLAGAKQHYTHAEGRVTYEVEDGVEKSYIQYKIADHLGNLMVLFGDRDGDRHLNTETDVAAADDSNPNTPPTVQLEIVQRHFYYAYGMEMEGGWQHTPDLSSAYRYNGKELLEDLGMDLYEYGARHFDAVIGRFTGVDPICEKYYSVNVYNYAECEPIGHVDLHGLQKVNAELIGQLIIKNESKLIAAQLSYDIGDQNTFKFLIVLQDVGTISGSFTSNGGLTYSTSASTNMTEIAFNVDKPQGIVVPKFLAQPALDYALDKITPDNIEEAQSLSSEDAKFGESMRFMLNSVKDLVSTNKMTPMISYSGKESKATNERGETYSRKFGVVYKGKITTAEANSGDTKFKGAAVISYFEQTCTENCKN